MRLHHADQKRSLRFQQHEVLVAGDFSGPLVGYVFIVWPGPHQAFQVHASPYNVERPEE